MRNITTLLLLFTGFLVAGCSESTDEGQNGPGGDGPFITGDKSRRVPKGFAAQFEFGDEPRSFAYAHVTFSNNTLQIEAVPGGKTVEFLEQDTLYFYWDVEGAELSSWEDLSGTTQELGEDSIAGISLSGKMWSAESVSLSIGDVSADAVEASFEGTYKEVKGNSTVQVSGTIKAYQGLWKP